MRISSASQKCRMQHLLRHLRRAHSKNANHKMECFESFLSCHRFFLQPHSFWRPFQRLWEQWNDSYFSYSWAGKSFRSNVSTPRCFGENVLLISRHNSWKILLEKLRWSYWVEVCTFTKKSPFKVKYLNLM